MFLSILFYFFYKRDVERIFFSWTSAHQVLEIRDDTARVIRSKRDTFSELDIVDYI